MSDPMNAPVPGCPLCAQLRDRHGLRPIKELMAILRKTDLQRCRCQDQRHIVLVRHPHVAAGCLGFPGVPTEATP